MLESDKEAISVVIDSLNEMKAVLSTFGNNHLLIEKISRKIRCLEMAQKDDFKKAFRLECGVEFVPEKIMQLQQSKKELSAVLLKSNKLLQFKQTPNFYAEMEQASYEKREEHFRYSMENLFDYVFDDSGKIQKTSLQQAVMFIKPIISNMGGRIVVKKGEYYWFDEFYISAPTDIDKTVFLDELTANIIKVIEEDLEQKIKSYQQDWIAAIGKDDIDDEIKIIQEMHAQLFNSSKNLSSGLILCGKFLLRVPMQNYTVEKRRLFDLTVFSREITDTEMREIYNCFVDFFWVDEKEPIRTFEEFKASVISNKDKNKRVPFILQEDNEFAGFFILYQSNHDCLLVQCFNTRRDLHDVKNFCRIFNKAIEQLEIIWLKTDVKYCTCLAPDKLILKLTEQVGFERFGLTSANAYRMRLDVQKYLKQKGLKL